MTIPAWGLITSSFFTLHLSVCFDVDADNLCSCSHSFLEVSLDFSQQSITSVL